MESLFNLPNPVKILLALLMGTSVLGAVAMIDPKLVIIVGVGMAILTAALVGYHFLLKWAQARKSKALAGQIAQHGAAAPNAISNPNARAKLDAMKRSFEIGMDKFSTAGKDVYSLPWYVVVGEPGAGKTEAIRHCNVGFPPGLQDEMQGVGGTINMNWWFTNRAVLLDTAGRLMFEEVAPGETHEWPEFLKLLRRNRPNCPINGLLLVIPCDSLIKDSEADITRKAGKIAQQLDVIQRTLDVRFPVFVLITKSDLLDGFREFFDDMDPDSQHQMVGWSNPQPRDVAFDPGLVDQHIQTVVARIRKRRLGLLKDPIPRNAARRTDEVDALYSLPESFTLAAPRLRSYLEKVFVAGPWSAKPLFLRGIYFTSAMREGAALDLVLAQAIGVQVDDLPEGRAWERERAYFLRDLFTEKIFRESGLVTRATNTTQMLRSRQLALYGLGFLACAVLLTFMFLSFRQFQESIGSQSKTWAFAKQGWQNGRWRPVVTPTNPGDPTGKYQYNGDAPVDATSGASTLAGYHRKLRETAATAIPVGWVFRPLASFGNLEGKRRQAQRIVYEGGVVKPVVESDRARMLAPAAAPVGGGVTPEQAALREANGLAALLKIEADALAKNGADGRQDSVLKPAVAYATEEDAATLDKTLPGLGDDFLWTYTKNANGQWPPTWLAQGSVSLAANKPIQNGLQRLFADASASLQSQEKSVASIKGLRDDLRQYRLREGALNDQAKTDQRAELDAKMRAKLGDLRTIKTAIDTKLADARKAGLLKEYSLSKEYGLLVDQSKVQGDKAFQIVHDAAANAGAPLDAKLFPEVVQALDKTHADLVAKISNSFNKDEITELVDLDDLLKDFGDGRRLYEVRTKLYADAEAEFLKEDQFGNLLGRDWVPLVEAQERVKKAAGDSKTTQEKLGGKFEAIAYFYDRTFERRTSAVASRYIAQTADTFRSKFALPLVKGDSRQMSREQLGEAGTLLAVWQKDIKSDNLKLLPNVTQQKLKAFGADIEKISPALDALGTKVSVSLVSYSESPDKSGLDRLRKIVVGGEEHDTSTTSNTSIGTFSVFGSCTLRFLDYSTGAQTSHSTTIGLFELAQRAGKGGKFRVNVDGLPVYLEVSCDGPVPNLANLPAKQKILSDL